VIAPDAAAPPLPSPRLGSRELFPKLAPRSYLNHAGISPPSLAVERAVGSLLDAYARAGAHGVFDALAIRGRLREKVARLVGARTEDVALTAGVSHAIQAVALSFPWRSGDRVVLLEGEFPANVTPWLRAAALFGLEPLFLPASDFAGDGARGLERLDRALAGAAGRARLLAASAVQFQTGLAMPLAAMAAVCARHGAEVCVDAIQAAGVVPLDVAALGVDYLAGGAHKWLLGAEGAGYLWIRPERLGALRPALAGWLSHEGGLAFLGEGRPGLLRYDRPLRRRADVFEGSSAASLAQAALDASLGILLELGIPAIHAHVQGLHDRLEPILRARGLEPLREPDPARRSGILSARPPPGRDLPALRDALAARGVAVAIPDGLLRLAPHWPNAAAEADVVADALDAALA
jgi:selenocysteine lyase/cysteine desulfurase